MQIRSTSYIQLIRTSDATGVNVDDILYSVQRYQTSMIWPGHLIQDVGKVGYSPETKYINMYSSDESFRRSRVLFWCLFPELRSNEWKKYQNSTRVSAVTVRHESTYITLFLTWHNESINDYKNDELYTSSPCLTRSVFVLLMTSQSIADDVTMTRQLWCDHVKSDL